MNLKGRSFLKLLDFTPEEILYLVDLAEELKAKGFITIAGRVNRQYFYERFYGSGKEKE